MFSKASKTSAKASKPEPRSSTPDGESPSAVGEEAKPSGIPSIISADLTITGDLTSAGDIQVDGAVEGDITSRTLTVGEEASVRGRVTAETMRVCGNVDGELKGQTVVVAKTAKVIGDIIHESLEIEAGAFIEGSIRRLGSEKPKVGRGFVSEVRPQEPASANGSGEGDTGEVKAATG